MHLKALALSSALALTASPALALHSAYDVGLRIAARHGYQNQECYAKVFAQHARYYPNARVRGWHFPLRNIGTVHAALWSECGIMR